MAQPSDNYDIGLNAFGNFDIIRTIDTAGTDVSVTSIWENIYPFPTTRKIGAGTLTVTQPNELAGTAIISGGSLRLGVEGALGTGATLFLIENATLDLNGHDLTVGDLDSYDSPNDELDPGTVILGGATLINLNRGTNNWAGAITGTGNFEKRGTADMNWYAANSFTGTLTVAEGTLRTQVANALSPNARVHVATGATLDLNNLHQTVAGLSGAGNIELVEATLTTDQSSDTSFSGVLSGAGGLTKNGAGTLTISGTNLHSGATTVNAGTLALGAHGSVPDYSALIVGAGGTFNLASFNDTVGSITGAGHISLGSGTLASGGDNTSTVFSGAISGTGNFTKVGSGWLSLDGTNTYTGTTSINAGVLQIGAGGNSGVLASTQIVNHSILSFNRSDAFVFSGDISGSGGVYARGTGAVTLTGNTTYTGDTQVWDGKLVVNTSLASSAVILHSGATLAGSGTVGGITAGAGSTLAPGNSPGTLATGSETWAGGASYVWEINDAASPATGAGTRYDLLSISGTLTINATSENKFTLSLVSLLANDAAGNVVNFNSAVNSAYTIATTTGGVLGFDASAFMINTTSFSNSLAGGTWSIALTNANRDLALNFTAASAIPEPSTYAALTGALALASVMLRRRYRRIECAGDTLG